MMKTVRQDKQVGRKLAVPSLGRVVSVGGGGGAISCDSPGRSRQAGHGKRVIPPFQICLLRASAADHRREDTRDSSIFSDLEPPSYLSTLCIRTTGVDVHRKHIQARAHGNDRSGVIFNPTTLTVEEKREHSFSVK